MIDERDLICKMAAEHCMSIAWLRGGEGRQAHRDDRGEAKRAYERLVAALHRAGYLARYVAAFAVTEVPPSNSQH